MVRTILLCLKYWYFSIGFIGILDWLHWLHWYFSIGFIIFIQNLLNLNGYSSCRLCSSSCSKLGTGMHPRSYKKKTYDNSNRFLNNSSYWNKLFTFVKQNAKVFNINFDLVIRGLLNIERNIAFFS